MKSSIVLFRGQGIPLEHQTVDVPVLREGELLVRIQRTTLCGSDLHTYHGRRKGPVPVILGHEMVGQIVDFKGKAPKDMLGHTLSMGDRITWGMVVSCGTCFYCSGQLPQKCVKLFKFGHEPFTSANRLSGGLAEMCLLPSGTSVLQLPKTIPDELASPINCATATVMAAIRLAGSAESMLIIGAGSLGYTAAVLARGLQTLLVCDLSEDRLARVRKLGEIHTAVPADLASLVQASTQGRGVDLALEISGTAEGFETGLANLRIGGTLVLIGSVLPTRPVQVAPELIVRRMLTIRGVHNYAPCDLRSAVAFLAGPGAQPLQELVGPAFHLHQAEEAFCTATELPGIRVAVLP